MTSLRSHSTARIVAAVLAVAGVAGLGLLAVPGGASAQPQLPPVSPEDLLRSVLTAHPGPFNGTVSVDNELGLPALPNMPQAANGTTSVRVWSDDTDGVHKGRVALPSDSGERDLISDGRTFWAWDSDTRTVTTGTRDTSAKPSTATPDPTTPDPTAAASSAIDMLGPTSIVSVDGTAEVAGRPAYELVLAPKPTERTLLREVRIAVDAEKRVPMRVTVSSNGSTQPALKIGFDDLAFGPQDPALFTFTPPPGATVKSAKDADGKDDRGGKPDATPRQASKDQHTVGDGWDRVAVGSVPADAKAKLPSELGKQVSGGWGSGKLISTAVGSAIVTDDGRYAVGAVPEQVLTEALAK